MLADGHGPGVVQKEANIAYRELTTAEKERLRKEADEENCADRADVPRIPRQRLIGKIVANIHANVGISHPASRCNTLCYTLKVGLSVD